jgi:hypothetical protein
MRSGGVSNTGQLGCDKSKGVLKIPFIFNGAFTSSDYASEDAFFTQFVAYAKLTKSAGNKVFVIPEAQEIADNSEANKEGSLGLGFSVTLVEGRPKYTIKFFAGADLLRRLRTFNNQTVRIFEYDANGVLWGTKQGSNFVGYQAKLFFTGGKLATGQNVEEGVVTLTLSILSNSEYLDNPYYVQIDENIGDVVGLIDAPLVKVSNSSNAYKYSVRIPGTSLLTPYDTLPDYGTAIAALSAQFSAKSGPLGAITAPLTITSITYDSTNSLLVVTYDSTMYAAITTGNYIQLIPPSPAQLDTGTVTGLELIGTTHVK